MNNPIFNFIEEGMPYEAIIQNMGFEMRFEFASDWIDEEWEEYEQYENDPQEWIENWNPDNPPDGFVLVAKYDTESGPCAWFVKPLTYFAKAHLDFGFSEIAQKTAEMGDIPGPGDFVS